MPLPEAYKLNEVFSAAEIAQRVQCLAAEIDACYAELGLCAARSLCFLC